MRAVYERHGAETAGWHCASRLGGGHGFLYVPDAYVQVLAPLRC